MKTTKTAFDVHQGELLLVNAKHPLPLNHKPLRRLVPAVEKYPDILLDAAAAKMLGLALRSAGLDNTVKAVSGYRTMQQQADIYNTSLRENGGNFTAKYVALPGCSEHQTGLAIDLGSVDSNDFIRPDFPYDGPYGTFRQLAHRYGFIERYPLDKQSITGIGHEPWHFRYVGWPHAELLASQGLALEEYIHLLGGYTSERNALRHTSDERELRVFTVRPEDMDELDEALRERKALWQASGNNVDGMVVTVWL